MSIITILSDEPIWRSRKVRYYASDWKAVSSILPKFELVPFTAGKDQPSNPFLQTVMRKPLSKTEWPMPVGIVSNNYSLVNHLEIAEFCRNGLAQAKINVDDLRYEVGLSELGEWMNFRIYLPTTYAFREVSGRELLLRLACFNSVDGTTRLVILFGWFRLVCSNGLVIGKTKIEIKERHGQSLDLKEISERLRSTFDAVEADRKRMEEWNLEKIHEPRNNNIIPPVKAAAMTASRSTSAMAPETKTD